MNSTQSAPTNTADLALLDAHIDVENAHRDLLLDAKRLRDRLARFVAELEAGEEQASIDPRGVLKEAGVERRFRVTDTPDTLSAPETPDGAS